MKHLFRFPYRTYYGLTLLFVIFIAQACRSISTFDQQAYTNAINLRVEALALVDKSVQEYALHHTDAERVLKEVQKSYLYVANIPQNKESTEQWRTISENLFNFVSLWQKQRTNSAMLVQQYKTLLIQYFDEIITLEGKKLRKK